MFKRITMRMRISLGFGVIIILLFIVGATACIELYRASNGFTSYREMARTSNIVGNLHTNMFSIRKSVKDYIVSGSDKDLKQYNDGFKNMEKFLEKSYEEIQDIKQTENINRIDELYMKYNKAFKQVAELKKQRNELVNNVLSVKGSVMRKSLERLMDSAFEEENAMVAYSTCIALKHVLLGRLYMAKFLDTNDKKTADRVRQEFTNLENILYFLDNDLENPEWKKTLEIIIETGNNYVRVFDELVIIIFERNKIIRESLDHIGPMIAGNTRKVKTSIMNVQDTLGPELQSSIIRSVKVIVITLIVAVVFGILTAWFIIRSITRPVRQVVETANAIARGDMTRRVTVSARDEIGNLAEALNQSAGNLASMLLQIRDNSENLAGASEELSTISAQFAKSSEETSVSIDTMASAAEQMSVATHNVSSTAEQTTAIMTSIASAVEEMAVSAGDIARNARQGTDISRKAIDISDAATNTINDLGESAAEIGEVTEVIRQIAQQTNLLALNATIEAASAGSAGKGFAVVANEIKELANQSGRSAEDIARRIKGVQASTGETIQAIRDVSGIIGRINESSVLITQSVEQQSVTSNEISVSIQQANDGVSNIASSIAEIAKGSNDVAKSAGMVARNANEISAGSQQLKTSSGDLAGVAAQLMEMIGRFKAET
ncbi:MAG: methyl-accepting chemotaxis protein [Desulfobacteraceae bacterium]|nr:methyl-accepting chemotaxis protein [Desulfobacteraceae bacterium]